MRALPLQVSSRLQESVRLVAGRQICGTRCISYRPLQGSVEGQFYSGRTVPRRLKGHDEAESKGASTDDLSASNAVMAHLDEAPVPRVKGLPLPTTTREKRNGKSPSSATPPALRATSLLEELFPHEVTQSRTRLPLLNRIERQVPRLPIEIVVPELDGDNNTKPNNNKREKYFRRSTRDQQLTVLVLQRASKYLTEGDFRRLVPGGKHIEGWTNKGDILQVICGRDRATMTANGVYFLLFATPDAAQSYKNHVSRLHRLSRSCSSPTALVIPPPPDLDDRGFPTNGSLQTYTLMPSTQDLHLRLVQQPFSPIVRRLVEQAGYDELLRGRKSKHEVLVSIDGYQPSLYAFRGAVGEDGKRRGLLWATYGDHGGFREMWSPPERKSAAIRRREGRRGEGRGAMRSNNDDDDDDDDDREADSEDEDILDSDTASTKSESAEKKHRRFIVSFDRRDEASRFAMKWHRRDVSRLIADLPPFDRAVANAEVIW